MSSINQRFHTIIVRKKLEDLVNNIREQRNWLAEINSLSEIIDRLDKAGKATSTRELANVVSRSKSWVNVSVILIRGLKVYPEIEKCGTRNEAYNYLQKKAKLRRFLES